MTCSINFTINKAGKLITKAKWDKPRTKNINKFRKFLLLLQSGEYNIDMCEAIMNFGKENSQNKTARKILKALIPDDNEDGQPVILPQDLGVEINGEG